MQTLALTPDENSYTVSDSTPSISFQALEGGIARQRLDMIGGVSRSIPVQWTVRNANYLILRAFYKDNVARNSEPFLVTLVAHSGDLVQYTANFVPDTFNLVSQDGSTFVVAATLEVLPLDTEVATWPTSFVDD